MTYTPTQWADGDLITAQRMNKLEQGAANQQIGPQGIQGPEGPAGAPGIGIPQEGTKGQVLFKASGEDYDARWGDLPLGISSAQVKTILFITQAEYDALAVKDAETLYLIGE